jgi:signal peptidase I
MSIRGSALRTWLEAILVAVMAATLARTFLAQGLRIDGPSMESALYAGDHVLVNRFVFAAAGAPRWIRPLLPARPPRRGEVLVAKLPRSPRTLLVKRCAAVPGDRVADARGEVAVDGYYLLGDRREGSYDSRAFGAVHSRHLVGKPLFVYWSRSPGEREPDGALSAVRDAAARTRWRRTLRLVR